MLDRQLPLQSTAPLVTTLPQNRACQYIVSNNHFCCRPDGELEYEHLAGGIKVTALATAATLQQEAQLSALLIQQ